MTLPRSTAVAASAFGALLAACAETLPPTARPLLPGHLADSLTTFTTLTQTQTFLSFRVLGPLSAVPGASGTAPIFPDSMLQRVFFWDEPSNRYTAGPVDAQVPATAVRFVLYAPDTTAGLPIEPTVQVGQADLLDASLPDTTRLRVFATGGTPMTTIDFTLRGRFAPDSISAFFDGCLFDALARSACLTDSIVQRVDNGDTIVTVAGIGSVTGQFLTYTVGIRLGASQIVQAVDLVVEEPELGETVRFFGTLAVQGSTPSANLSVTVNGLPFATIQGQGTLTIRGPNNQPLTDAEDALLNVLFALPGRLLDTGRALARPGQRVLGG